jgi:hypothetical protein
MHSICLGVIRYFIFLWISPNQKENPWYLGDKLAIINQRLKNTKPPYEVTRTPQSLLNIKFWKASEFRAFALYYFYVLEDILPEPYFQHFLSLSYGLFCCLQQQIEQVRSLFKQFVRDVASLYGREHVTANIHFLTHVADAVFDLGGLWATSTFIPEWINGELASMSHGSQGAAVQMAKGFLIRNALCKDAVDVLESNDIHPQSSSQAKEGQI